MPHTIKHRGQMGLIKWGYREVASLVDWTLDADATGGDLSARVVAPHDPYAVSQAPLWFVVPRPNGNWQWPIERLQIEDDGALSARVGPPKG